MKKIFYCKECNCILLKHVNDLDFKCPGCEALKNQKKIDMESTKDTEDKTYPIIMKCQQCGLNDLILIYKAKDWVCPRCPKDDNSSSNKLESIVQMANKQMNEAHSENDGEDLHSFSEVKPEQSNVIQIACPRLEDIGEIKAIIKEIMNMDIFDDLNKHHQRWNLDFKDLDEDKYYDSIENYRHLFRQIEDRIEEIYYILYKD